MTCVGEEEVAATGGGDDGGGGNVVELAASRADVERRDESGRGREFCRVGGGLRINTFVEYCKVLGERFTLLFLVKIGLHVKVLNST